MLDYALILVPLILVSWLFYARLTRRRDRRSLARLDEAAASGLTEPFSLHPFIDPYRCLGSGACVLACPEGDVLGMIGGKSKLINPTHCIGHGACRAACPHEAITLVFGTEKRGVDIPHVSPTFETNVPGIFIAGELGGMGLIRNAVEQGRQAIDSIRKYQKHQAPLDVVIIGAGPAGFSASLAAMQHRLRAVTIEQESLGGRVFHYPRAKIVMLQPATLPLVGKVKLAATSKEALLEFWQGIERKTGVKIQYHERMEEIARTEKGFVVKTSKGRYETRTVLLAVGRGGTPRKLGVPGEELAKVVYRLIDPEQYRDRRVLVVGGGDAALEAACRLAEQPGATVTLSYRGEAFGRAKPANLENVKKAERAGRLRVLLNSQVKCITPEAAVIEQGGEQAGREEQLPNDGVIVCAGGVLPTELLKSIGVWVQTKYGTA
ncbi:MAG: NAD(P)-binding domain-containing protein [Nitrospirae bacterium]|nr:NAD(P)-binding domain-containing protein [Nitrospirota bacterium]